MSYKYEVRPRVGVGVGGVGGWLTSWLAAGWLDG